MGHKYPKDLVFELLALWRLNTPGEGSDTISYKKLPEFDALEELISTCYQVSQMQEEARGLRFRVMLCEPEDIDGDKENESQGLFTLVFSEPRPYNEYELSKIGPSTDYNNSLIGIRYSALEGLQIWGLIHSGSKWMHVIHGGSKQATPLPPALGINIVGSGRLIVCRGQEILAQLSGGNIISPATNVFQSQWVAERFGRVRDELALLHEQDRRKRREAWALIDPSFVPALYLQFFKHVISTIRRSGHGGTVISFPVGKEDLVVDIAGNDGTLLAEFRDELGVRVLNIDPATNIAAIAEERGVPTINDFWSGAIAERVVSEYARPKLITATNVFAHVDDVRGFE